ncbi:pole-organizing protein PopZ [Sphingomonas glacialis]|uniref:Pole-organizing protein PopZ n=2 Tax=Sphingomonas glacialis TaxID=658225 RepID=A0ABQ3LCL5_9SPHN|nr:pole-organizing protein PopZ [Sphingomonas glacialis]
MGDLSAEPSMEDILSSIKRIIAEENDATPGRSKRPPRALPPRSEAEPFDHDILELSEPVHEPEYAREPAPRPAAEPVAVAAKPAPASVAPEPSPESLLSARTAEASRSPLDALSRLVVKPEVTGSDTLEGVVREMLRPMLRDWLDANLPTMVEAMVAREIDRITGK